MDDSEDIADAPGNTSNDSNHGSTTSKQDAKKQQFTRKQRMDMYAWCVVELELNGHTVSIKKQQQAIKKLLKKKQEKGGGAGGNNNNNKKGDNGQQANSGRNPQQAPEESDEQGNHNGGNLPHSRMMTTDPPTQASESDASFIPIEDHHFHEIHEGQTVIETTPAALQAAAPLTNGHTSQPVTSMPAPMGNGAMVNGISKAEVAENEAKTLLELQQEIAANQRCYSDYQKTQVLTSRMLSGVQKRFAKYYPDAPCPSRTTIKHVFEKCVEHGSVDNVKNPRKATKIPNGDEVEYLLMHEPQMSLRQMARELNVSIGTVSRRCQALGLVPESVTIKHQQMAIARRQKQIKQLDGKTIKANSRRSAGEGSRSR